jgi:hypothetical protein
MVEEREGRKQVSRCRCPGAVKECMREDKITDGSVYSMKEIDQARLKYNWENVFQDGKE